MAHKFQIDDLHCYGVVIDVDTDYDTKLYHYFLMKNIG